MANSSITLEKNALIHSGQSWSSML
jgi:hypothetical protein